MHKFRIFGFIFALLLIISSNITFSQITWSRIFGGIDNDEGLYAKQTQDGNFLMINIDFIDYSNIAKFSSNGTLLWRNFFPDTLHSPFNFAEDLNGNIYFATNKYLVKSDPSGSILWIKSIPVGENHFYNKVFFIDSGRNLLILGNQLICKADTSGNIKWQKIYSNISQDIFFYDFLASGNFYYMVGLRKSNFPQSRAYILKTDTSGNQIWDKYSGFTSRFYGVSKNSDNTFISCGLRSSSSSGYYAVKFDINSNYIWEKTGLPDSSGACSSIFKINANKYVMTSSNGQGKGKVIQIDSNGSVLNNVQHYYHGLDWAQYNSIMGCSDSGFIIAGYYEFNEQGPTDCLIIKTDKFGNTIPIGIEQISSNVPAVFKLHQNYPNPFNPSTKIRFEIPYSGGVSEGRVVSLKFNIHDITGREVYSISETKSPGIYEITFDASKFSSGMFFYSLEAGSYKQTRKMVLLK